LLNLFNFLRCFESTEKDRVYLPRLGPKTLKLPIILPQIMVHIFLVAKVVGHGSVDFFQLKNRERLGDVSRGRAAQKRIDNGIERNSGTDNPEAAFTLLYVLRHV
jgi:hypothetical protein